MAGYRIPQTTIAHELLVKGSRFIAVVGHTPSVAARQQFVQEAQQRWPQASHYCLAAITGPPNHEQSYAMSDDGEPSGTAGRPMLQVLMKQDVGEVTAVVVRYFGGTKLGTGGLQRAYSQVVIEAMQLLQTTVKVLRKEYILCFDYADQAAVDYAMGQFDAKLGTAEYQQQVKLALELEPEKVDAFNQVLHGQTQGRVTLQPQED